MSYSLTRDNAERDASVLRDALDVLREIGGGINEDATIRLQALADSIEEQVKPTVEEPTGDVIVYVFGTVYRKLSRHWYPFEMGPIYEWDDLIAECRRTNSALPVVYRPEVLRIGVGGEYSPSLQQIRDLLLRSPTGYLTNEETLAAYKDLRKGLNDLLSVGDTTADEARDNALRDLVVKLAELGRKAITAPEQRCYQRAAEEAAALLEKP